MNLDDELNKLFTPLELSRTSSKLYQYQKAGVEFLKQSNGRAIVADQPGLGKTAQALTYIAETNKNRSLVICPASMKYVWEDEVKKWTKLTSYVITSKDKIIPALQYDLFIINYDILKKHLQALVSIKWDIIIGDEGHFIKSTKSLRSRCFKAIARNSPEVILLTGTPILSRPIELFNLLNAIDPKTWNSWWIYAKRYCNLHHSRFGLDVSGASNLEELNKRIKKYFIRRTKEEVLKELPPKQMTHVPIVLDGEYKKEYDTALYEFKKYLKEVKQFSDEATKRSLQAEKLVRMGYLRQITSLGKVKYVAEMIDTLLNSDEKVVVFSNFNKPLLQLKERYDDKAVVLIGSTSLPERKEIIDKFQTDDNTRIFFGGIKSGGIGITLTSSSNVIFIDYSFVPADHIQASDRLHRIGNRANSINIYQFFAQNTIDEYIYNILEEKQEIINKIMGEKEASLIYKQLNIFEELLKRIEDD